MLIDWFTVCAQALNFLILVWLLKRFLYQPILDAIDAREKRIAAELADAAAKQAEAHQERDEFQRKNGEFDKQRAALLSQATDEARAERQRLLEAARQEADAASAKRQDELAGEYRSLRQEIVRRTREGVFAISRKALTDLAGTSLERQMVAVFVRQLQTLNGQEKVNLKAAYETAPEAVRVRSAFDLPGEERACLQHVLNETFSADVPVRFETAPDLIGGIELTTNGQKVSWSIGDYLASLEKGLDEVLPQGK